MYEVPSIPYLRLRFLLHAEEAAQLPPYQGSMLRGAFGHALRGLVCVMGPEQPCQPFPLRHTCAYPRIFEPALEGEPPPFLRGVQTAPRPYVIEPNSGVQSVRSGEELRFDLILIGQAVELQGYAVLAVERMAAVGLASGRRRFRLVRAEAPEVGKTLFEAGSLLPGDPVAPTVPDVNLPNRELEFVDWERYSQRQRRSMRMGGWVGKLALCRDLAPFGKLLRTVEVVHVGKGAPLGLGRLSIEVIGR